MITQRELDRYQGDCSAARIIASRAEAKKSELIHRLDMGERIEGGPLSAEAVPEWTDRKSTPAIVVSLRITSRIFPPVPTE